MTSKEQKRINILNASIKVFSKYGFHKAKIQQIADEAEMGKGTIYEYFDSKKNLFEDMIKHMMEYYIKGIKKVSKIDGSFKVKILSYLEYNVKTLTEHINMFNIIMNESNEISKEMQHWMFLMKMEIYNQIESIIEEAIVKGELRNDLDKEVAAFMIIGTSNQYCSKKIFDKNLSLDEMNLSLVIETLINGLQ